MRGESAGGERREEEQRERESGQSMWGAAEGTRGGEEAGVRGQSCGAREIEIEIEIEIERDSERARVYE
eukprot:3464282-Rhodomonas_salina.1